MSEEKQGNTILLLGILLPVLIVVAFIAAAYLPGMFVAPPKFDVLYLEDGYSGHVQVDVQDGRVIVQVRQPQYEGARYPAIIRYHAATGSETEYPIDQGMLPVLKQQWKDGSCDPQEWRTVMIPDLAGLEVSKESLAPDGYQWDRDSHSGGGFGLFWGYSSGNQSARIVKSGRVVSLGHGDRYYYNTKFIGWVVGDTIPQPFEQKACAPASDKPQNAQPTLQRAP